MCFKKCIIFLPNKMRAEPIASGFEVRQDTRCRIRHRRSCSRGTVILVVGDSHIQLVVRVTKKTKLIQRISHNIDLSNANPACDHKEARRSTGHIMVTTGYYSNQEGSKSRQNPCQVQPPDNNIGNLSAPRRCFRVRTTGSFVWSAASILESELQTIQKSCLICCPSNKAIQSDYTFSILYNGELHEDNLCDTLQGMAPTNVKTINPTSLLHFGSNPDRPTASSVLSIKADKSRSNQF